MSSLPVPRQAISAGLKFGQRQVPSGTSRHVWMAPAWQGLCDVSDILVGGGHVSGVSMRLPLRRPP
jgi:hypothetical protein